jgi:hypothetical protein
MAATFVRRLPMSANSEARAGRVGIIGVQCGVAYHGMPPLAIRCSPVIHRASFDARKTAIDAMFNVRAYSALHAMS